MRQQLQSSDQTLYKASWQAGSPARQELLRSESESNSSGRLCRVRPAVSVECPDAKIGIFVNVTSIFSEQRPVSGQRVVDPTAIEKSTFRLGISAGHKAAPVAGWMKHQTAASAKNIGVHPGYSERKVYNCVSRGRMHVRLNSRKSACREILLGVAVITVVCFAGEPAVEVITVTNEKPAGICSCPRDPLAVSVLGKKARALHTDLRPALLSHGAKS